MNKSINLYINYNIDAKNKIDCIKETGYEEFYTGCYDVKETLNMEEQLKYAQSIGLKCTMIHCSYVERELNDFWLDNEVGEKVLNNYLSQIERCKGLTKNFVVHLNGSKESIVSEIGLKRINKMLQLCEKYNINLCIENLFSAEEIPFIFKNIKHKNLKICFDIGHKNFLTPEFDLLNDYAKYVTVLHLHDNDGKNDLHQICGTGTIDWEHFAKQANKLNKDVVLSAEIKYADEDYEKVIRNNFKALQKLDKLVEKYAKNTMEL